MKRFNLLAFALLLIASMGTLLLSEPRPAGAVSLVQLSSDPFTNSSSQHRTQVEPDTFSYGSTIVAAFQSGRFFSGGASDIGWATSVNGGTSWSSGFLPGFTKYEGTGSYDRASDPAVAYDARHGVWMIASLALSHRRLLSGNALYGKAVVVNRSMDGGLTWGGPVVTSGAGDLDKNWVVCDNWPASPYYGNCYVEYDDLNSEGQIKMVTSADGGLSWDQPRATADGALGLGGQPVVQPNGDVIVPAANSSVTAIIAFRSTNGGVSWGSSTFVSALQSHNVDGGLRGPPLPSAEIDAGGKVYVVWHDCRYRAQCASNDIVMATSNNGLTWSAPVRIPIDDVASGVDHFLPGLGVDVTTQGASAHLALAYYYYPAAACGTSCDLNVGFISSADGGSTWSAATQLAGPMLPSWLATTSQGVMVGDYISVSFSGGVAFPAFAVANQPGTQLDEAIYTVASGLRVGPGSAPAQSSTPGTAKRAPKSGKRPLPRHPATAR